MEKERQVRMTDVRREARRQLEDRSAGASARLRRGLAGRGGLAAQAAMLSPRRQGQAPAGGAAQAAAPATPQAPGPAQAPPATSPQPGGGAAPQTPAAPTVSQEPTTTNLPPTPAAPIPATPVPEAEPPTPVPAAEPMAPIPGPPASLTGGARPLLRQGSSGDSVVELQSLLNQRDEVGQHLAVDGLFGPKTAAAVRQFQAAHPPLAVDAVVGPMTWGALDGTSVEPQDATALALKLFERGSDAYDKGNFAHAYDLFTSSYEHAQRPGLVFSRAQALRRLGGRVPEAIALYEQYIGMGGERSAEAAGYVAELKGPPKTGDEKIDNTSAKAIFDKGAALYEAGDYAHAYDEFTKAYGLAQRPGLLFSRGQALRRLGGRAPEAIALYEQYIAAGGDRAAEAAGYVAELKGPAKTGIEDVDAGAAKAIFDKGAALYDAGDYAHAYDEFMKAYNVAQRPGLLFSAAQALRNLGARREEAIALYKQYLAKGGDRQDEARFYIQELTNQGAISPTKKV